MHNITTFTCVCCLDTSATLYSDWGNPSQSQCCNWHSRSIFL